jgi:hypothetical protein
VLLNVHFISFFPVSIILACLSLAPPLGVIKYEAVSEAPGDPAGDSDPSMSMPDAMLKAIEQTKIDTGL